MLPSDRCHTREQSHALRVPSSFFERQQVGEDAGIVIDDAVRQQTTTFAPQVLRVFGAEAKFPEIGLGHSAT